MIPLIVIVGSSLIGFSVFDNVTSQATVPLASFRDTPSQSTFAQLETAANPFWQFFIVGFTAPVIEEIVLGFFFMFAGVTIGQLIREMVVSLKGFGKVFDFVVAMIVSMTLFTILHTFNQNYSTFSMFMIAFIFRGIMNLSIYLWKLGLLFSIGVHFAFNWASLGGDIVGQAFFTFPWAIILWLLYGLILFKFFSIIKEWPRLFMSMFNNT